MTPNFHEAVLRLTGQEQVAVLRHGLLPLLAFARPRSPDECAIAFTDHPDLSTAISELSDLHIATAAELSAPLSEVDLTDLSDAEHRQIAYWNPATVGELLFNFWD